MKPGKTGCWRTSLCLAAGHGLLTPNPGLRMKACVVGGLVEKRTKHDVNKQTGDISKGERLLTKILRNKKSLTYGKITIFLYM